MCASHVVVLQTIRELHAKFDAQISRKMFLFYSRSSYKRFDIAMRQRFRSTKRTLISGCQETHQQTQLLKFASYFSRNPIEAVLGNISIYFPSKFSYKLPNEIIFRLKRSINEEPKIKTADRQKDFLLHMDGFALTARIFFETRTEGKMCEHASCQAELMSNSFKYSVPHRGINTYHLLGPLFRV